jgi:hypothetical protein
MWKENFHLKRDLSGYAVWKVEMVDCLCLFRIQFLAAMPLAHALLEENGF